jgi:hypothetical protein
MSIHPIRVTLENGAKDCRLKLLEGRGTWGRFGDNNFLVLELDDPRIVVNVLESHPFPEKGTTEVRLGVPGLSESLSVLVSQADITLRLAPDWSGERASFTLYFNASSNNIIFDAMLSRSDTAGMVTVYSPDGDETDYLLANHTRRRVTLPLTPALES